MMLKDCRNQPARELRHGTERNKGLRYLFLILVNPKL